MVSDLHTLSRQDVDHVEKLQKLAAQMVQGFYNLSYDDSLPNLDGVSALAYQVRHKKLDFIQSELYKVPPRHDFRGFTVKVQQTSEKLHFRIICQQKYVS